MDRVRSFLKRYFRLSKFQIISIIVSVILAVLCMKLFFYKDDDHIADCCVSPDEQYIAFVKQEKRWGEDIESRLICFDRNGCQLFETRITDYTAGGSCDIWFEDETIVVYFLSPHRYRSYSMSGEMQPEYSNKAKAPPELFRGFKVKWEKRVYTADDYVITYNEKGLITYYALNEPRTLTLTRSDGTTYTLWSAYAQSD